MAAVWEIKKKYYQTAFQFQSGHFKKVDTKNRRIGNNNIVFFMPNYVARNSVNIESTAIYFLAANGCLVYTMTLAVIYSVRTFQMAILKLFRFEHPFPRRHYSQIALC